MVQNIIAHVPRRIQRYAIIFLVLVIIAWVAWRSLFGPRYAQYRQQLRAMDMVPDSGYGTNSRPTFKDIIHVKTMDERHLPAGNKRLVVVGDVHGCKEELKELLQKVHFDKTHDHLVLTGDIINKGPDSPGVVSFAKKLGASCVRGNHEDKLLLTISAMQAHHVPLPGPDEEAGGREDFIDEESHSHGDYKLRKLAKKFSEDQISWLRECPVILRVGQIHGIGEVVVVHAGLVPGVPLDRQDPVQCMNMRTIDPKTRVPSENRDGTEWEKIWKREQKELPASERVTVIYGHDAKRGLNIKKYTKGLDSGCVRGGHLTALVIDARGKEKVVQVKCKGYVE